MTDKPKPEPELVTIPASEWGPGCMISSCGNHLKGASGKIYMNVRLKREDIMRLWPPKPQNPAKPAK